MDISQVNGRLAWRIVWGIEARAVVRICTTVATLSPVIADIVMVTAVPPNAAALGIVAQLDDRVAKRRER
jgi:hypothetical protein